MTPFSQVRQFFVSIVSLFHSVSLHIKDRLSGFLQSFLSHPTGRLHHKRFSLNQINTTCNLRFLLSFLLLCQTKILTWEEMLIFLVAKYRSPGSLYYFFLIQLFPSYFWFNIIGQLMLLRCPRGLWLQPVAGLKQQGSRAPAGPQGSKAKSMGLQGVKAHTFRLLAAEVDCSSNY